MEYVTGAGWRRQEEAANVRGYQLSATGNFGGGAPTGGGPRTEYVTRARRRREAEAQELATQEREEGPAKKNYGGEHIGNQREQAANVVRKHILNGGVAEGDTTLCLRRVRVHLTLHHHGLRVVRHMA